MTAGKCAFEDRALAICVDLSTAAGRAGLETAATGLSVSGGNTPALL